MNCYRFNKKLVLKYHWIAESDQITMICYKGRLHEIETGAPGLP